MHSSELGSGAKYPDVRMERVHVDAMAARMVLRADKLETYTNWRL
jgi:isocitrate/isopropylmalate dehydrogenase